MSHSTTIYRLKAKNDRPYNGYYAIEVCRAPTGELENINVCVGTSTVVLHKDEATRLLQDLSEEAKKESP